MPLYIKDDTTTQLVNELAKRPGTTKQAAVRLAVQAEWDRVPNPVPLRDRFAALRTAHPLPEATGRLADRDSFDELSAELP